MSKNASPKSRYVGVVWHEPRRLEYDIIVEPGDELTVSFVASTDDGTIWEMKTRCADGVVITAFKVGPGQHTQMTFGSTLRQIMPGERAS